MATSDGPGSSREALRDRYAVATVDEDEWHRHSDAVTLATLKKYLPKAVTELGWVLNAGAGVSRLGFPQEISLDLFSEPIAGRQYPVCASIARLPFCSSSIDAVVCVGEVLAYCDPSDAISEFARVMRPNGRLIIDFGSTKSWRVFATPQHGVAATALVSDYNGSAEKTWIYDPDYISHLLTGAGYRVIAMQGAHAWSSIARRFGLSIQVALKAEKRLWARSSPIGGADTITIVSDLAVS